MRCRALIATGVALASLSPAQPAVAAGPGNEFLAALLGHLDRHGSWFACFSRQYDDAHLAAHPEQRVTFAKALIDGYFRGSVPSNGAYEYQVSLAFKFRDRTDTLASPPCDVVLQSRKFADSQENAASCISASKRCGPG